MAKFYALVMSMLIMGVARAAEDVAAEVPVVLPEPNYVGIVIFLVLMIGSGVWFVLKMIKNKGDKDK